jgi:hypothetical protein
MIEVIEMSNTIKASPYAAQRRVALASTGSEAAGNLNVPAAKINPRTGALVESHTEPLIGTSGDLNAGNKNEVMQAMSVLQKHLETGRARKSPAIAQSAQERGKANDRLVQAFHAQDGGKSMLAVGEVLGEEIWQTLGREGFARKVMMIKQLAQGEIGRLRVRKKDVRAHFVVSAPNVLSSQVRQNYVFPPEFVIAGQVLIEDKEIAQSPGDLLEDKYQDGEAC